MIATASPRSAKPAFAVLAIALAAVCLAALCLSVARPALAQPETGLPGDAYHLVIGIDVSENSPFVTDDVFAGKTARRIAERIAALPMRSKVSFRSFGAHSTTDVVLEFDREISRNQTPQATASFIRALIAGMPEIVRNGTLEVHGRSDILGFLGTMARSIDCAATRTVVIVATDGFEDSEFARMSDGGTLPDEAAGAFSGCARLEMLGLGRGGGSPSLTQRIVEEWKAWGEAAGFTTVIALDSW